MDVGPSVLLGPERRLDVAPVPQRDRDEGTRKNGEADAVRQGEVRRETQRADLGVPLLVERQVGVEDLEDVEALQQGARQRLVEWRLEYVDERRDARRKSRCRDAAGERVVSSLGLEKVRLKREREGRTAASGESYDCASHRLKPK